MSNINCVAALSQVGNVGIFLQNYPDAESWAFLDKLICQWRIEEEKVRASCGQVPAPPYGRCQLFRNQQPTTVWLDEAAGKIFRSLESHAPSPLNPNLSTVSVNTATMQTTMPVPAPAPTQVAGNSIPADIQCNAFNIDYNRMCGGSDRCCGTARSETNYCWSTYDTLGDAVASACYHCCATPMLVGPATPVKSNLPKTIQCSSVDNPFRICKDNSCCSNPRSTSSFCQSEYAKYTDNDFEEICYYCCSSPKEVGGSRRRNLRSEETEVVKDISLSDEEIIPEGAKVFYANGKRFLVRKENFEENEEDEQVYFDRIYAEHKQRSLQQLAAVHEENYADITWFPYDWNVRVQTEYYFRYEGTMLIPPCFEIVTWRQYKDPIKVHRRQIDELNRLLAWRINPATCNKDSAGIVSGDGNKVNVNRALQFTTDSHKEVFCECKNWPSKFATDKMWCHDYQQDTNYDRFFKHPYNFESGGTF